MRVTSSRSFASTVLAAILWRLLNHSQAAFQRQKLPRLLCLPSDFLGKHIISNGLFERETIEYVARILDACKTSYERRPVFLDIGANIGNHTCFFANRFSLTIAVEPSMVVASILRSNILLNNLQDSVIVLEAAFSESDGTLMHYTATGDNLGGSSLDDTRKDTKSSVGREVPVHKGDDAVLRLMPSDSKVSFIKIDVEGHEYSVIRGLLETLRRDQPVVLFEADSGVSGKKSFDLLREVGYCKFLEIVGDADEGKTSLVRFVRRIASGAKAINVREIFELEPRYYEAVLALPQHFADQF